MMKIIPMIFGGEMSVQIANMAGKEIMKDGVKKIMDPMEKVSGTGVLLMTKDLTVVISVKKQKLTGTVKENGT